MFPTKRISPFDGLSVTADVWEEAHAYHRLRRQIYALFSHGPGIVAGLEIQASDPPDSAVYILPGMAVNSLGQIIVLTEATAFDIGEADGMVYLLVSYGESKPRPDDRGNGDDGPLYVHAEFVVEAGPNLPDVGSVELARIRRADAAAVILEAQDALHPGLNEIDTRFRLAVGSAPQKTVALAMSYVGGKEVEEHKRGLGYLARAVQRQGDWRVWVDWDVPLTPGLEYYTLVCLVGQGAFELSPDEMRVLYDYVQGGGTLFIESCRSEAEDGAPPADAAFADMLASLGFELQESLERRLLVEPFLFAAPPPGFEIEGAQGVRMAEGVIWSARDYGCLWQGARRDGPASRDEIRAALEWGSNVVAFAVQRRDKMNGISG